MAIIPNKTKVFYKTNWEDLLLGVAGEKGVLLQKKELSTGSLSEFRTFLKVHVHWILIEELAE